MWQPVAAALRELRDVRVFGLPLDEPGLLDACTPEERSVFSDERTAAFAALGRAILRPDDLTVLSLETGPSFVNALLGLSEATSGRVALLVVVEAASAERRGWGAFQDLPVEELCRAMGMQTRTLHRSDDLVAEIRSAAMSSFECRSPTVVVLRTRGGSEWEQGDGASRRWSRDPGTPHESTREELSAAPAIDELRGAASNGARVTVVCGGGAKRSGARADHVDAIITRLGASALVTASGRGLVDEKSDHFAGLAGLYATPRGIEALASADVIVSLGSALEETVRERWAPAAGATVVVVDDSPVMFPSHDGRRVDVVSDTAEFLALAYDRLAGFCVTPPSDPGHAGARHSASPDIVAMWAQIESILVDGRYDVLCVENGLTDLWGYDARFLAVPPSTSLVVAAEQAAMGAALCGSLGAERSQKTLVICGDATVRMHLPAVSDAVEARRSISYIVSSNAGMGWPSLSRTDADLTTFAWNRRLPAVLSSLGVEVVAPDELRTREVLAAPAATFFDAHPSAPPWES